MSDWNERIVEEFRANGGEVGGRFEGRPLLLLHHRGARTGTERVSPLMYQDLDGAAYAVFASKAGADSNPDWFHNLVANPETSIEVGSEVVRVKARVAEGDEREQIWQRQKQEYPFFAEYEERTSRAQIPVLVLEPVGC
jgi:deazaflavin-dependent oxidoreductase (nitroreductase family)